MVEVSLYLFIYMSSTGFWVTLFMVLHCHLAVDFRNTAHSGSDYWCMLLGPVHVSGSFCSYSPHPFFSLYLLLLHLFACKVNYCHSWPICSLLDHILRVHFLKYFTIQFLTFYLKYFKFLLNCFQWSRYITTCLTWHPCLNTYFPSGWILTLVFFMIIIILSHFILECIILLETVTASGFANTWPIASGL